MNRHRLYKRMVQLGKRAGAANVFPHRFRDTFAVDMLQKGFSPYAVAKMLGDTIPTIEKHYTRYTKELRERAHIIIESGEGLEKEIDTFWSQSLPSKGKEN